MVYSRIFTHSRFQNIHPWSIPNYSPPVMTWRESGWQSGQVTGIKPSNISNSASKLLTALATQSMFHNLSQNLKIFRRESKLLGSVLFFTRFCLWENPLTWQVLVCSRCSNIICIYISTSLNMDSYNARTEEKTIIYIRQKSSTKLWWFCGQASFPRSRV